MGELTAKTAETPKGRTAAPGPASSTGSTRYDGAAGATSPAEKRSTALLHRLRTPRRPRLWFEILLIGFSYWLYSMIRNAVPEKRSLALHHADWVWSFEHNLGLAVEHGVNHAVNSVTWLIVGMNYYYATLHFVITIGVLVWLYVRHPERYGPSRLVLFVTTWLALVGFWAFPLAPPRLMNGKGFLDTVELHHTWGSLSQGSLSHVSNQYAAMPSMHIGWSLWCGITLVTLAKPLWARVLGALYPLFTLTVIVATGNHFWLDAVGGALCLAVGYALVSWLYGRWVYRLPVLPRPAV
ncbi:phosphatase PAP2 family protein [Actinacidiphila rubida]|uniref:PAP2 superfamily protein n=1 Tax=Actinacidiphila rubida TaxID=310780 RepID=A0A1H8N9H3_9ACTN|nr:phosphatase PAP2 family protein [Actinacidiphila rubida]SEO26341.1 PAP2 superfamily protein [Actinacidiphila rubida]